MTTSATFMGHLITSDGLRPDPTTVVAVTILPTRHDKQGIRRFLGAINYLSKFCPRLSSVTQPLRDLTKDDVLFVWSNQHQKAFDETKSLATSAPCLKYYDVNAPVVFQVDASDYGLGAVNLQPSRKESVGTDHQPLHFIFQKDLASAPKCLQKMMLSLQRYSFSVFYRKGTSLYLADTFSRAPCRERHTRLRRNRTWSRVLPSFCTGSLFVGMEWQKT